MVVVEVDVEERVLVDVIVQVEKAVKLAVEEGVAVHVDVLV